MQRRTFNIALAGAALTSITNPLLAKAAQKSARTVLYNSVGDTLTHYDVDVEKATLTKRSSLQLPSVIQYGWPHPSNRYLYVATTDSERGSKGITGAAHFLYALRPDANGNLVMHGERQPLRQRPIHNSVDNTGRYVLTAYNAPAHVSVHHINPDGTLGSPIEQSAELDVGVFAHQIQTTASNQTALLVTRGNNPSSDKPKGEPGAIKAFHFDEGRLTPYANITVGGQGGYGYGPRHLDFHPTRPWMYTLVELQNQLHTHRMDGDLPSAEPIFIRSCTQSAVQPGIVQVAGAIHVHPRGHVVYASNRVSATTHPIGAFPFEGGENNIAVFAIHPTTGEPTPIQFADPHGFHIRAFSIDPGGRLLIAASLAAMIRRKNGKTETVPAGLSLFRIADDGRLTFARRYEVDLESGVQQMWVRSLTLPA